MEPGRLADTIKASCHHARAAGGCQNHPICYSKDTLFHLVCNTEKDLEAAMQGIPGGLMILGQIQKKISDAKFYLGGSNGGT